MKTQKNKFLTHNPCSEIQDHDSYSAIKGMKIVLYSSYNYET